MALIPCRWIRQMLAIFLGLNSKGLYQSSGKEKQSRCLVFTFATKREIRHFHIVVVLWLQRNVQKSVMHVQICCFANLNQLLFLPSSLTSPSSLLKLPIVGQQLPTLLDVTCCVSVCTPCCKLLRVVRRSCCAKFETGQSYMQTDATTSNIVGSTMFRVVCT